MIMIEQRPFWPLFLWGNVNELLGKLLPSDSFLMRRESRAWLQAGVLSEYDASYKIDKQEVRGIESVE